MDVESLRKRIVYRVPGMDTAVVQRDVAYQHISDPALRMDVYAPHGLDVNARLPAVIFIHGGPISPDTLLRPKDWGVYMAYGELMAASGLVGVTFNHRLYGRDFLETASRDIAAAIGYVRHHADALKVDAGRLCLWAFSGGGPQLGPFLREPPAGTRCMVSYYATLDLRPIMRSETPPISDEILQRFSPVAFLQEGAMLSVPMLIVRAGRDYPVINETVDAFVQAALALNAPIELVNHPEGQHGFDILDDSERSRDIIARTVAFIRGQLLYS
jgi:acetyl esterase/lipase